MKQEVQKFIGENDQLEVFRNDVLTVERLLAASESPDVSIAAILLNGINEKVRNLECDATYVLLAGMVSFLRWNNDGSHQLIELKPGDSVHIPKGTWYQDVGRGLMVNVCQKAFDPGQVERAH